MTPADEKTPDETPETEVEATETEAPDAAAEQTEAVTGSAPQASTEDEATEEKPKPKRTRAKKADAAEGGEAEAKKPVAKKDEAAEEKAEPQAKPKPAATPSTNGAPVVRAHAKYVRTSARKARLVCDHIRGKSVAEARAILAHTPRAAARDWAKLLESAVANAEHNHELLGEDLRILSINADEGPTLKRFQPRAMGRASRIRKRTSHLSIALTPKES